MKAFLAVLAVAAMVTCAQAASLRIRGINTAGNATPALPSMGTLNPLLTPNAKGFLIRIHPEDSENVPVGVQNVNVTGTGIVQFAAPPEFIDLNAGGDPNNLKDPLRVQTRSEANNARDFATDVLGAPLNYPREDTYLAGTLWSIVSTPPSLQPSGNPGDQLWNIGGAAYSVGSNVSDPNDLGLDFIYLVTTADARIQLTFARGQTPIPMDYVLDFETMTIAPIPEPSTIVLAGLGLIGLVFAWRRRK